MPGRRPESITVQQVADIVFGVSESTVYRLIAMGAFPHAFKVGRQLRIPRADVLAYQQSHRLKDSQSQ